MSDMFSIKHNFRIGDVLTVLLFSIALEYDIVRDKTKQDSLKLYGAHQLLVHADAVQILGGSIHGIKKNTEILVVASNEIGIEVNADKTT